MGIPWAPVQVQTRPGEARVLFWQPGTEDRIESLALGGPGFWIPTLSLAADLELCPSDNSRPSGLSEDQIANGGKSTSLTPLVLNKSGICCNYYEQ